MADRLGITDFFPGLGQWVAENRRAIEAPGRARSLQQAETLLGAPAREASSSTDELGLTTGFDAFGGAGLMEDPNDFYNQMQYSLGLMSTPYYEQAGQNFASQAISEMLTRPSRVAQRQQEQQQWAAEQRMKQIEQQRKLDMYTGYGPNKPYENQTAYNTAANALFDDAKAVTQPLRDSLRLYGDVQRVVGTKGLEGMSLIDDTLLIKTLAKVQNPSEAVMEGDVKAIAQSDTYDALLRTLAGKVGLNKQLNTYERQQLYDALQNMGQQRAGELAQSRQHLTAQAMRRGVNPLDVLMPGLEVDVENYRGETVPKPLSTSGGLGDGGGGSVPPGAVPVDKPPGLVEQEPPSFWDKLNQLF